MTTTIMMMGVLKRLAHCIMTRRKSSPDTDPQTQKHPHFRWGGEGSQGASHCGSNIPQKGRQTRLVTETKQARAMKQLYPAPANNYFEINLSGCCSYENPGHMALYSIRVG